MPKYLIEREIPNAAAISPADLKEIAQRSCAALKQLGSSIQWVQSYVTEVARIIDPTTAEANELAATAVT
jgi:hypothetical protein